jgi:hypothetical protein
MRRQQVNMEERKNPVSSGAGDIPVSGSAWPALWQLDVAEVTGHNLEARGREEVNRLLTAGWRLLHIYTLKYEEEGVWRERPMAILGRLRENREERLLL